METTLIEYSEDFKAKIAAFRADMHKFYTVIGAEQTPQYDGAGRKVIDHRPDGKDYIIEAYMRNRLDFHFPGWSWEMAAPLHFLGAEWVVAQGHLCIIDPYLLVYGIHPPVRKFYGVDSVRIQYKKDSIHEAANIIDVGDNCKQANSAAFKYAINRLTCIGDDVYGKRIDEEGAGTAEQVIMQTSDQVLQRNMFMQYIQDHKIKAGDVFGILGVQSLNEITDYITALQKLKGKI
jgi:hypothetical protein